MIAKPCPLEASLQLHLPLVGELHPLRRAYEKTLLEALTVALLTHLSVVAVWTALRSTEAPPITIQNPTGEETPIILTPPPSITQPIPPQIAPAVPVAPPQVALPEPVPDYRAVETTIATTEQFSEFLAPTDQASLTGGSGTIDVDIFSGSGTPAPTDFVAREEEPKLITMPAPDYPDLARRAGIEGKVLVRALVGIDGRVHDAFIVNGNAMLNDAALQSVRAAVFRPALQQQRPIAVWVVIPLQFVLNE